MADALVSHLVGRFPGSLLARTADNSANLPKQYLELLMGAYDKRLAKQELDGQWVDLFAGRVYYAFDRELHVSEKAVIDKNLPVYLCCDFNVTPMSWIVTQRRRRGWGESKRLQQEEVLVVGDEIIIDTSSTQEAAAEFLSRGYTVDRTVIYGDAAGHHSTTLSDYAVLSQAGFNDIRAPKSNPIVLDRVASVNAKLKNARSEIGILIHPRCERLIEDLARVGFKAGTRRIDKSNHMLTHASDAVGYLIVRLWPAHKQKRICVNQERY